VRESPVPRGGLRSWKQGGKRYEELETGRQKIRTVLRTISHSPGCSTRLLLQRSQRGGVLFVDSDRRLFWRILPHKPKCCVAHAESSGDFCLTNCMHWIES
jgi:hypothetical protein